MARYSRLCVRGSPLALTMTPCDQSSAARAVVALDGDDDFHDCVPSATFVVRSSCDKRRRERGVLPTLSDPLIIIESCGRRWFARTSLYVQLRPSVLSTSEDCGAIQVNIVKASRSIACLIEAGACRVACPLEAPRSLPRQCHHSALT
jgi:hypothetical protein